MIFRVTYNSKIIGFWTFSTGTKREYHRLTTNKGGARGKAQNHGPKKSYIGI